MKSQDQSIKMFSLWLFEYQFTFLETQNISLTEIFFTNKAFEQRWYVTEGILFVPNNFQLTWKDDHDKMYYFIIPGVHWTR